MLFKNLPKFGPCSPEEHSSCGCISSEFAEIITAQLMLKQDKKSFCQLSYDGLLQNSLCAYKEFLLKENSTCNLF